MSWMKITVEISPSAAQRIEALQDAIKNAVMLAPPTKNVLMVRQGGRREPTETFYFSPAAVKFARSTLIAAGAVDCAEPDKSLPASLEYGDANEFDSWRSSGR